MGKLDSNGNSLRNGIKQLTGTAVDKTGLNLVPTAFMAGFQCHAIQKDQNKNQNCSKDKVQNLGNERR